jgi:hypothetical protein
VTTQPTPSTADALAVACPSCHQQEGHPCLSAPERVALYPCPARLVSAQEYLDYLEGRDCPTHGRTRVADTGEVPSMLGSGWEPWEVMDCGCTLTLDPFNGHECWSPRP